MPGMWQLFEPLWFAPSEQVAYDKELGVVRAEEDVTGRRQSQWDVATGLAMREVVS